MACAVLASVVVSVSGCASRCTGHDRHVLLRLAYLTVTNAFAALRLLPMSDRDKDVEILTLRHQLAVLQRHLGPNTAIFTPADRAFLAALLHPLPRTVLRRLQLLIRPDTVLRWHRDLMRQRHADISKPKRRGRPPTVRSIRILILRLARDNPSWGYRRVRGELATLGVKVAASTVWEILRAQGMDPAPDRSTSTWADFLRGQAQALLAVDFIATVTLTGQRQYILAVIEHATRRIRVLGTTAHPTAAWVSQAARNLVMDLDDAGVRIRYLIRDRDAKFPAVFDRIFTDTGIDIVLTGERVPRMNSIMERWVRTCRRELLDRTLIWNERHLRQCLHEFELHYNEHRPHQAMSQAAPLRAVPAPITDPERLTRLRVHRNDRLGGVIHEYQHAA
jgi:putative transposase